ncbi:MAG: hypothetical protein P9M00_09190 [Candidatus Tritonobacter lacicola]|nr:hypothetical protein [Candidatus Tritonobacter lacicola]
MKKHVAVAALFLFLTCVGTYPLCFHLADAVSFGDRSGDHLAFLWNLWWAKKSLVDLGTNPYFTEYLFHPRGKSLIFHTLTLPYGIASIPLQVFPGGRAGLVLGYNLIVMSTFVLSGYFMYFFVWKRTGSMAAGIVSGVIFAFAPFRMWHLNSLDGLSTFWLPLAAYPMTRMLERGEMKYAVLSAAVFVFTVYTSYLMAVFIMLFLAVAIFCRMWKGDRARALRAVAVFFAIALVLVSPLLRPLFREAGAAVHTDDDLVRYSTNLLAYVVPYSPLTIPGRLGLGSDFGRNGMNGCETFLGYIPLFLCLCALMVRRGKEMLFWVLLGSAAAIISLGPYLHIWKWIIRIRLPFYFVADIIPFAKVFRVPGRFSIVVSFAVAVLAGYGFLRLRPSLRSCGGLLCPIVVALVMMEFCPLPNLIDPLGYYRIYDRLAAEEGDFAVLEIPLHDYYDVCFYMYGQTVHEKKLLCGALSRVSRDDYSLLRTLPRSIGVSDGKIEEGLSRRLRGLGVRYIIYHGPDPEPIVVKIQKSEDRG